MPEPSQGAMGDSPAPDVNQPESSTGEPQVPVSSEQGTPQQPATTPVTEPEVRFDQHPRFQELIRERDQWRQTAQELVARSGTPAPQPVSFAPADQWEPLVNHPDPATAQFWQTQRKLQEPLIQRVSGLERAVETGTHELAELRVENFRLKNPDISPNSQEEQVIAGYVRAGYPLEAARKMGLFDLHYGKLKSEVETIKGKQATIPQKIAANATAPSSSIPAASGLPGQKGDWRDRVREAYRKGGELADIANAVGMRKSE